MGFFDDFFKGAEASISTIGKSLEQGVQQVGKNIEKNVGGAISNLAYAVSTGNFNNFDQTLLQLGTMGLTGGLSAGLNPASLQYKETAIERATREAQEKVALEEINANATKEKERLAGLANMLSASASARALAPGMSQTLLGGGSSGGLLVTPR